MTPKEKAHELVNKFRLFQSISYDDDGGSVYNYNISKHNAKQCAIICVEEILDNTGCGTCKKSDSSYWYEVKTEIEKL
jgi:hypothetical protein